MKGLRSYLRRQAGKAARRFAVPARLIQHIVRPRACHVYCVGAPKTGTKSLANIFQPVFRSRHEPFGPQTIAMLEARWEGRVSNADVSYWLRGRDTYLWLECEAFHVTAWFSDVLAAQFAQARFILNVRDCYSWVDAVINQHINVSVSAPFQKLRNLYHAGAAESEDELSLEFGLYTIDGLLTYWARHNSFVLDAVPSDRLLVVPTLGLSGLVGEIAEFAGVPTSKLTHERSHSHRTPKKHEILNRIDRDRIAGKIEQICGPVIQRLNRHRHLEGYDLGAAPH